MDGMTPTTTQQAALAARYGAAVPAAGPWNATIAGMLDHCSVRGYRPDALPPGTLETLVAAAQSAATSSNLQTWSVVSVEDPAARAVMTEVAGGQKHIMECPLFLVFLADVGRNDRMGIEEGTPLAGMPYLETFLVAAIDAALAAQNAVVAAESLGLSTVYIGALRNDVQRVADTLGLPSGTVGVFGLCVGYAKPGSEGEVKPRLPQTIILHRGRYDTLGETVTRAAYDAEMSRFSQRNEMAADTWTARVIARVGSIKALRGRDRLAAALNALGFPLK
jgi:nitroreductase